MDRIIDAGLLVFNQELNNPIVKTAVICVIFDLFAGTIRAIKSKTFNSSTGIDGTLRKVLMLTSLAFLAGIDSVLDLNFIGFIPQTARDYINLDYVGLAEIFSLLYITQEASSALKNMDLCGLPVKSVREKLHSFLSKYTDELKDIEDDE